MTTTNPPGSTAADVHSDAPTYPYALPLPLYAVRDLDREIVRDGLVHATFMIGELLPHPYLVVGTPADDAEPLLWFRGPFDTAEQAADWATKYVAGEDNHWTVAPLGRPLTGEDGTGCEAGTTGSPADGQAHSVLTDLAAALTAAGAHVTLHGADTAAATLAILLPYDDQLCVTVDPTGPTMRLRWCCEDMYGYAYPRHDGYLDWTAGGDATIAGIVEHLTAHTAVRVPIPDYPELMVALAGLGLSVTVKPGTHLEWLVEAELPDQTYLIVAQGSRPPQRSNPQAWSVKHYAGPGELLSLVYAAETGGTAGDNRTDREAMVAAVRAYVAAWQTRAQPENPHPVRPTDSPAPAEVWMLMHWDRRGEDVTLYASEEAALAGLAETVRSRWHNICDDGVPRSPDALSDRDAVATYFAVCDTEEGYRLNTATVTGDSDGPAQRFGLTAAQVATLLRLAAAVSAHADTDPATAYTRALASFTEPDAVHALARATWQRMAAS